MLFYPLASVKRDPINASAAGDSTVLAAVAGKQIVVLKYSVLCTGGANTITWKSSGGTALTGPMGYVAQGGISETYCPVGIINTLTGEGLLINLSAATQVGGCLSYIILDPAATL